MPHTFYKQSVEFVLKALTTSQNGLSQQEATKRLKEYGPNEVTAKEEETWWSILLEQFKNFFIILLLAAAIFSFLIGEALDAMIIAIVVSVNVVIGFVQGYKAAKALAALKKLFVAEVTVMRQGRKERISRTELVPGDIVLLETGDKVAADLRLVESQALKIDESILTGESAPVVKGVESLKGDKEIGDQINMAFTGTLVVYGRGAGVVVATGDQTEFGKIAHMVTEKEEPTPLEQRLHIIGEWFTYLSIAIGVIVFVLGLARGQAVLEMFTFVIALLVAAVPESLPVVLTLALAFGAVRLARRHSIIRRLPVVETLGDVDVIASDKTGTLTRNEMTVTHVAVMGTQGLVESGIAGVGYVSEGELDNQLITNEANFIHLVEAGVLVNESEIRLGNSASDAREYTIVGDPTEAALLILAEKVGRPVTNILNQSKRIDEVPFDSAAKFMATLNVALKGPKTSGKTIFVKGAPEVVLEMSTVDIGLKKTILRKVNELAQQGLRVLALAGKPTKASKLSPSELKGCAFYGLVGLLDPVREGIREALDITHRAGIRTIIITGDHALTAQAIAWQLGMKNSAALTGQDLKSLSDPELAKKLDTVTIFARTSPEDKLRIVKLLQQKGRIVAVTGDGINDAPALKAAQVGVAMGMRGTDVTRETADLILMDDSFATIVKSIEMGRGIFDNVKKFIILLLSGNIVEVMVVGAAFLLALPSPLTTIHLLWINLVTDSFPALALGFDPPKPNILQDRPELRNRGIIQLILSRSLLMALVGFALTLAIFIWSNHVAGTEYAQTMTFTFIVLFELTTVFILENDRPIWRALPQLSWLVLSAVAISVALQLLAIYGPGERIFETTFLTGKDWVILGSGLVGYYFMADLIKLFAARTQKSHP